MNMARQPKRAIINPPEKRAQHRPDPLAGADEAVCPAALVFQCVPREDYLPAWKHDALAQREDQTENQNGCESSRKSRQYGGDCPQQEPRGQNGTDVEAVHKPPSEQLRGRIHPEERG